MHYHCEIVLPPDVDDIESAISTIMDPFNENHGDSEDYVSGNAFWDFYVIGGRFAGNKLLASYDKRKIDEFYQWCEDEKITVSGLQCGKQELEPKSQISKVDEKWNEMFPSKDGELIKCPIFSHSNDQYGRNGNGTITGDICKLSEAKLVSCSRVIFSGPSYDIDTEERTGPLEASFMLCDTEWNGVNHMKIDWDGTVGSALNQWIDKLKNYRDSYQKMMISTDDWIVVTVDYHS